MKTFTILSCSAILFLIISCDSNHNDTIEGNHGRILISCEHDPYYINIDSLVNCTENRQCSYTDIRVDSLYSDFIIHRSGNGFEIHIITPTSSSISVEYDDTFEITNDIHHFSASIHNVYIGGCYNDEIIWSMH